MNYFLRLIYNKNVLFALKYICNKNDKRGFYYLMFYSGRIRLAAANINVFLNHIKFSISLF